LQPSSQERSTSAAEFLGGSTDRTFVITQAVEIALR
jgi:hypothetical protein